MHKNEIRDVYKEIDKEGEIYTEGFTPEQIYYQVEGKIKEAIEDSEKVVIKLCSKTNVKDEHNIDEVEEGVEVEKDVDEVIDEVEEDVYKIIDEIEEIGNDSSHSSSTSFRIENVGTDYSDCSSVEEDTYSQDSTLFDPEDLKIKPASELFKTLDKNIRRTK